MPNAPQASFEFVVCPVHLVCAKAVWGLSRGQHSVWPMCGRARPPVLNEGQTLPSNQNTLLAPQRQADKVQRSRLIPGSVDKVLVQNNPHLISKTSIEFLRDVSFSVLSCSCVLSLIQRDDLACEQSPKAHEGD